MTQPFDAQTEFSQRIDRIRAGGQGTNRTLYVGNDTAMTIPQGYKPRKGACGPRKVRAAGWLVAVAVLAAASLGAASYAATTGVLSLPDVALPV